VRDDIAARILAHRQNIRRYRALLRTPLTEIERAFIDRRIGEEEAELIRLRASRESDAEPQRLRDADRAATT